MKRVGEAVAAGLLEGFVRAPAAGGVALLLHEAETVARGVEMHRAAVDEIGLHCGAERVDVRVGMLAGEHVFVAGERREVGLVLQEALCECAIA